MEQGTLSVAKSNRGKIIVKIRFEKKGKTSEITVQNADINDLSLDGKAVEFEREGGQIRKVICDGDEIFQKKVASAKPVSAASSGAGPVSAGTSHLRDADLLIDHLSEIPEGEKAKAPYNFIPLNRKVVEAEPVPDFNRYHEERYTGWIDIALEAKTPLYIRDTMNRDEMDREAAAKRNGERFINSDFFGPGNRLRIPGSSLRGMVRTLMEIAAHGRFGFFEDKHLYYRGLADMSNLRSEYQNRMSSRDKQKKKSIYKMSAGILEKQRDGFGYFIRPGAGFEQIYKDKARERIEKAGEQYREQAYYRVNGGWIVVSGPMQKKKRDWLIHDPTSDERIPVPQVDIKNYQNDKNRAEEVIDLLGHAAEYGEVPCFYVQWKDSSGNNRITFGHTGMFRLAYEMSIGEHIPKSLRTLQHEISPERTARMAEAGIPADIIEGLQKFENRSFDADEFKEKVSGVCGNRREYLPVILKHSGKYDITEAVFGNTDSFAGRVSFEDAMLDQGQGNVLENEEIPKLLQGPKPTTFQHYLVQSSDHIKDRKHYNENAAIRGNKMYWHKKGADWVERNRENRERENLITKIRPVKPETNFSGRIRFENLTAVELGALLFVLDLPEGCLHKLGMGKPIGLGSVKITPELHLSDREKRYQDLFSEWDRAPKAEPDLEKFKNAFETHVGKAIGAESGLWDTGRMKELKTMLDFEKGVRLERENKIRYMEIGQKEYKERPILPLPSNV